MRIRSIETTEISRFEQIGVDQRTLNLQKWLDANRTKLEWCFVAEASGEFLARVIYGVFSDQPQDLKIWQLKIDHRFADYIETGKQLIHESLAKLKESDFTSVEYHLYDHGDNASAYQSLFVSQGFNITQEKRSFEACQMNQSDQPQRLYYKCIQEVGEDTFIEAIESVTVGTLDRDDIESVSQNGSTKAARMYFELLKEIDFNRSWWRLAYDVEGRFVGLVVPQRFDEACGAINYIGVAPDQRGNGYVYDLLREASNVMLEAGLKTLIAEIDIQNQPLDDALRKLGFHEKQSLTVLKKDI